MRGTAQPQTAMCRDRAGEDRIPAEPPRRARLAPDGAPPSPARRTPRLLKDRLHPFAATTVSMSRTHRRYSAPGQVLPGGSSNSRVR